MTRRSMRSRRVLAALALAGLALLAITPAAAQPPPPNFVKFTITNNVNVTAHDVKVMVYPVKPGGEEIDDKVTATLEIGQIPGCQSVTLSLPATYGIAKIRCWGTCPAGRSGEMPPIIAPKGKFNQNKPDTDVYAGFLNTAPEGQPSNLTLTFDPPDAGDWRVKFQFYGYAQYDQDPPKPVHVMVKLE